MSIYRKLIIAALAVGSIPAGLLAQIKLDAGSRARVRGLKSPIEIERVKTQNGEISVTVRPASRASTEEAVLKVFITASDTQATVKSLEELGVTIDRVRGNIILAQFPESQLSEVQEIPTIKTIKVENTVEAKMDIVRDVTGVNKIHQGEALPQAYTGKGVVTGIVDGGFDPNHVNFKNEDGTSRIKKFTYFRRQQNSGELIQEDYDADYIPEIDTENDESFHATHTAGIMAGGYRGDIEVAVPETFVKANVVTMANPYYGIAYESDIATAAAYGGQLSDYYIAMGCESILDYAFEQKKPCVINLSLGNNIGPHDGTSPICQYLDGVISDDQVNAHVCISAGNEGDSPIALHTTFTDQDSIIGSGINPLYPKISSGGTVYNNPRAGQIYIYSDTKETFDVQVQIVNLARKKVSKRLVFEGIPEGGSHYWLSDNDWLQDETDEIDLQLARYFTGYVGVGAETDEVSGRYYSVIDFTLFDNTLTNGSGTYVVGFEVIGHPDQRIDIYCDGNMTNLQSLGYSAYSDGIFDGTINDISTGYLAISVGSYNVRNYYGIMGEEPGVMGYWDDVLPLQAVSSFTSYGQLIDGRTLPDICAPGATIISSTNEYFLEESEKAGAPVDVTAALKDDNRRYSYQQCLGTSMASPVVAGIVALWLEAYPELTATEAKKVMQETAVTDEYVTTGDPMQWGAGKIDAYAGLKKVLELKNAGIGNVVADSEKRLNLVRVADRTFTALVPGAESVTASLYNMAGSCVFSTSATGNELTIDASGVAPGVYVLNVNNAEPVKIILK